MKRPWVAIQRNPTSGSGSKRSLLLDLVGRLRTHGLAPRLYSRRGRLEEKLRRSGAKEDLVCIVAAGGDGTVGDIVNRFPGIPVAILPMGTENLLARYLEIPKSGIAVADMIAARHSQKFDLGVIGDKKFTLMASFGFDAEVVHRTHARRSGHITRFSYLQPIGEAMRKYTYPELRLYVDDAFEAVRARLVVVANLPVYALGLKIVASACGDDGLFDICLFQRGSTFQMLRYFLNVTTGTHTGLEDVESLQGTRVRIESSEPVPVQVDGDPAGWTPTELRVEPCAFEVIIPEAVKPAD